MTQVVRVEFPGPGRYQYCTASDASLRLGETVVVETDWGVGMGKIAAVLAGPASGQQPPARAVIRRATATDLSRRQALDHREREARAFCRDRILARGLAMKLTEVRIGLDSSKALFYFTADGRVDFRELVKDLVQHLRTRVELRQIGVRDESRILGCAGGCGRPACCRAFLQGFAPVSIRMAKDQNLALNPGKLSGICGRLKCCLTFEHSLYAELKRGLPKVGAHVATAQGVGTIRAQNILEQTVQVGLETGGQITLGATEVSVRPKPEPPPRPREAARPHGGQPSREPGRRPPRPAPPEPVSDNEVPADLKALEDS